MIDTIRLPEINNLEEALEKGFSLNSFKRTVEYVIKINENLFCAVVLGNNVIFCDERWSKSSRKEITILKQCYMDGGFFFAYRYVRKFLNDYYKL